MLQNLAMPKPRAAKAPSQVCRPPRLRQADPELGKDELAFCPFPQEDFQAQRAAFKAAPHFRSLDPVKLYEEQRGGLRLLLLVKEPYYARQAAMYIASLWDKMAGEAATAEEDEDDPFSGLDLSDLLSGEGEEEESKDGLLVVSPRLLDPELDEQSEDKLAAVAQGGQKQLEIGRLRGRYVLLARDRGGVLSKRVYDKLELMAEKARGVMVAIQPGQVDYELMEELRLTLGFRIYQVESAGNAYLAEVLRSAAGELHIPLAPSLQPEKVVAALREKRRERFSEGDIYSLLRCAAQNARKPGEYTAGDLDYVPFDPRSLGAGSAREELERMVGLEKVKTALTRQLAVFAMQRRYPEKRISYYRSLAFAGPPGTGKSATARLVARILREEGCGNGRFVEAGREQLVGKYLGHTSINVSRLFDRARGGVLFIDEAGALLDPSGHDSYAEEAVNGLVRHMELEPDTLVIFATYGREMQELLSANPGLSSRVAEQLEFPPYSEEELWAILRKQGQDAGWPLSRELEAESLAFFRELKRRKGENFGNGREARRLFNAMVEEMAVRTEGGRKNPGLIPEDFRLASARLLSQENKEEKRSIGF